MSSEVAYFGYGSLVNELTWARKYEMVPAEIRNWMREWRHCVDTPWGRVCALTVSPLADGIVQGAFIKSDLSELQEIDEREIGYERVEIIRSDLVSSAGALPDRLFIYKSGEQAYRSGDRHYPLWLSYVEVVIFGYWRVFGEEGVDRFMASTKGWNTPIIDDRTKPLYPRFTQLNIEQRAFIEGKIRAMDGVTFQPSWE